MGTAGPAAVLATTPVSTKIPVPMITPTPKTVRSRAERFFLSWWSGSSVSRIDSSTLFTRALFGATSIPSSSGRRAVRRPTADDRLRAASHGSRRPACRKPAPSTSSGDAGPGQIRGGPVNDTERTTGTATERTTPASLPPTLRPRPAGVPREARPARDTSDPVLDCGVYVHGRRQDVAPAEALQ